MLTVTKLARQCGLSRTAVLYYESVGLMPAPARSQGNYRCYGQAHLRRLREICAYRQAGLTLGDIRAIVNRPVGDAAAVLKRRLLEIDAEIRAHREHQQAILKLLQHTTMRNNRMITKEKWVSIMSACGLSDAQMHRWHTEFERSAPEEHQEFLEFLHIPPAEIASIRAKSKTGF